jgi:TolA-binding protein
MALIRQGFIRSGSRIIGFLVLFTACLASCHGWADDVNEKAMAAYADAANFQTNGAIPLAIQAWQKYLKEYPNEPLVSKASHYLGVCFMQQAEPDYSAAAKAFERAIADAKSDLREESLVNLGWCHFAAAGDGETRDPGRLTSALNAFKTLIKEKPTSKYIDRALFYGGEAAYALGDAKEAVDFYDKLLALDASKESPLRCDALYARGIALEDLKRFDSAMASYRQLLEGCKDGDLALDAKVRLGDASILQKKYDEAIKWFSEVASTDSPERPYAILRQAFAMVQADRPADAAALYERLVTEFPSSPYAAVATLASAQTIYRAGDLDEAAKRFSRVLQQGDKAAATEAAHWLATIALRKGRPDAAVSVAEKQIASGVEGPYATTLKMDLAEALMLVGGQAEVAMKLFRDLYTQSPESPEAARALYNAAFAAMQLGKFQDSTQWAAEFVTKFPKDSLIADVRYIAAESKLMAGDSQAAADDYLKLVDDPVSKDKIQRPLWVMRGASALSLAGKADRAIELLGKNISTFAAPQQAEGLFMAGTLQLAAGRSKEAASAFEKSLAAEPNWPRADETRLQLGQAYLIGGDEAKAAAQWQEVIKSFPKSPRSDQARYRLAQASARANDYGKAVQRFDELLVSGLDPSLRPFALYGRSWNLMRADQAGEALKSLEQLAKDHPEHPLVGDAKLARGMCLRAMNKPDEAMTQLEQFLASDPQGINRGHALYEMALIDQSQNRAAKAAERLGQLAAAVPNYPGIDKVIYEWAWSLKESGNEDQAEVRFKDLIQRFPENPLVAEGHYFLGQRAYEKEMWADAADQYAKAYRLASDPDLKERAIYRRGWALYRASKFKESSETFATLVKDFPAGVFLADGLLMVGEGLFKLEQYPPALAAYEVARKRIIDNNESEASIKDSADRQIRELVFLHGGQCHSQMKRWVDAIDWFNELKTRFPSSTYLPQAQYEIAYALQQSGKDQEALAAYAKLAEDQRNEIGARARFMMGEIHFGRSDFINAIPEFQRVMYGYGAEQAPVEIKNWQAKSGFEAGRCSELMMQSVKTNEAKAKTAANAAQFFNYVIQKHPQHELAPKSQERVEVLKKMGFDTNTKPSAAPQ